MKFYLYLECSFEKAAYAIHELAKHLYVIIVQALTIQTYDNKTLSK